jgi:hypothetical protein
MPPCPSGSATASGISLKAPLDAADRQRFSLEGFPRADNFEMIAQQSAFHRGPNEAQLFEIVARKGGLALRPLSR